MKKLLIVSIVATATALGAFQARAGSGAENFTPAGYALPAVYYAAGYAAACPFGSFYACHYGALGGRYCGCWLGGDHPACPYGYSFACGYGPYGSAYCACY